MFSKICSLQGCGLHGWVAWTRKASEQYVTVRFTESSWMVVAKFSETKTTQVDVIEVEILVVFFLFFCFFVFFSFALVQALNQTVSELVINRKVL